MTKTEQQCGTDELVEVDVADVLVNPFQPRREFDEDNLEELSNSIREVGLIHPPTVRRLTGGGYELIAGERRLRAVQRAGIQRIPVLVHAASDHRSAQAALVENFQRVDLNPIEIAAALQDMLDQQGLNHAQLANKVGKKRSTVANYLRLLTLPPTIRDSVSREVITMGHAKVILSVEGATKQKLLHDKIVCDSLTVRQAEKEALRLSETVKPPQRVFRFGQDEHLQALEQQLQKRLGTKVQVTGSGKQGKVVVNYYGLEDLDRLTEILGIEI